MGNKAYEKRYGSGVTRGDTVEQSPNVTSPIQADLKKMPIKEWLALRHQARTNLEFLCREVLTYKDFDPDHVKPHASMIVGVQKFKGGTELEGLSADNVIIDKLRKGYKPAVPMWDLESSSPQRKTLFLVSRGFLKSSVLTIGHSIQWIINYPNVRILLSSGTGSQVEIFMSAVLQHFRFNDTFRWLFPEHVPHKSMDRFGSGAGMTTHARHGVILPDKTLTPTSIDAAVAGGHYDVIKHDDVVNEVNVRTPDSIAQVNQHFADMAPLLDRRHDVPGWTDYIGTRYDYTDAYGKILDSEKSLPVDDRIYSIVFEPAWTGEWDTPNCVPTWPERMGIAALKAIENDPLAGANILASQYGLIPRPGSSGLINSRKEIIWTPHHIIQEMMASLRLHVTMDLHGMANQTATNKHGDNDYTAITLAGFSREGHCYIISVYHGRPTPLQVIDYLFNIYDSYPSIIDMKCQTDHMANTLMPFIRQAETRKQKFLPLVPIAVNNQISKVQKIKALQPWFATQRISISTAVGPKFQIEEEIIRFPKYHDDILDTFRDQMENRNRGDVISDVNYNPPIAPLNVAQQGHVLPGVEARKFLGFGPGGEEMWSGGRQKQLILDVDSITGL